MSTVTYTRPPNRLGRLLSAPGGKRLKEAIAAAEVNLKGISEAVATEMDAAHARLREAAKSAAEGDQEGRAEVYAQASAIVSLGAVCGHARFGQVAYNLCELTDRYIMADRWNADAVSAHLDMMILLRTAKLSDAESEAIFAGLRALVHRAEAAPERAVES